MMSSPRLALMGLYAWGVRNAKENMIMTNQKRTKRIATWKVGGGYRVTGQRRTYSTFPGAFQAAWRSCAARSRRCQAECDPAEEALIRIGAGEVEHDASD